MQIKLFKTEELYEMLLDNDIIMYRITPSLITPETARNASYFLMQGNGIGNMIRNKQIREFNKAHKTTILSYVTLNQVMEFVIDSNFKNATKTIRDWTDAKTFTDYIVDTYEDTISELCTNEACGYDNENYDFIFDECINDFYYLLKGCFLTELPNVGSTHIEKTLCDIADYFFGELIPKLQAGINSTDIEKVHHLMLLHFYELVHLTTLYRD